MEIARMNGFNTVHTRTSERVSAETLALVLKSRKQDSPYEIDGIVVHDDNAHDRKDGENPKYAFAFKSMLLMEHASVTVKGVEWNISKDGYIKPTVLFDDVHLSGVSIKRATGHNAKFIVDNKIGVGAKLVITRSGDVIPFISKVVQGTVPSMPDGITYKWNNTHVDIVVTEMSNAPNQEQEFKNIEFFFKKIKVEGVSSATLRKLFNAGYNTVGKILDISLQELMKLDGVQNRSAHNIVNAIQERISSIDVLTLMAASNAFGRSIGDKTLEMVAKHYPSFKEDKVPELSQLVSIKGIEDKTAHKIIDGMKKWQEFKANNKLDSYIKILPQNSMPAIQQVFSGKVFVFTGVRNEEMEDFIKKRGGEIKGSVSKKTDYLIVKDQNQQSSKLEKANEFGVQVLSIDRFYDFFRMNP